MKNRYDHLVSAGWSIAGIIGFFAAGEPSSIIGCFICASIFNVGGGIIDAIKDKGTPE